MLSLTMHRSIQALTFAAALGVTASLPVPVGAQESIEETRRSVPGEGGDAVLPAGYQGIVWSAAAVPLQHMRGKGMEPIAAPAPGVRYLLEAPPPGDNSGVGIVKWKLWTDRLIEVQIHFPGPFTPHDGRALVQRFEDQYGSGKHEVIRSERHTGLRWTSSPTHFPIVEERWVWEDPFTTQILRREVETEQWTCIRKSRLLDAARAVHAERAMQEARSEKVQSIELD